MKDKFAELYNSIPGLRRLRVSALESDKPRLSRVSVKLLNTSLLQVLKTLIERNNSGSY